MGCRQLRDAERPGSIDAVSQRRAEPGSLKHMRPARAFSGRPLLMDGRLLKRVLPGQTREAMEVRVGGAEHQPVLHGECRQVGVGDELGPGHLGHESRQDLAVALCRLGSEGGGQGPAQDVGGCYMPDLDKATAAMCPSGTLNGIMAGV